MSGAVVFSAAMFAVGIWAWTPVGQRTLRHLCPYVLHLSWSREFGLDWWLERIDP